jgi:protein-export membrane protein, SecD/SecF family/protein-export membrane protein SecD
MLHIPFWKRLVVLGVVLVGFLFAAPTFLSQETLKKLPSWLQQTVSLGLDLQGGSHLLLEVDVKSALKDQVAFLAEDMRTTLRKQKIDFTNLRVEDQKIVFQLRDAADQPQALKAIAQPGLTLSTTPETQEITAQFTETEIVERQKSLIQQSREIIDRRINNLGTKEPNIQTQGTDRIIVQLPGVNDPSQVKELLGKTAKLTFQLVHPHYPTLDSAGGRILPGTEAMPEDDAEAQGHSPKIYLIKKQVLLTGENLINARPERHPQTNAPYVSIQFDTVGARKFGEVTKNHTGERLAMILDGKVISAPHINEPILGGSAQITGDYSYESAINLAILLRSGALPAPITVIEERTVGPDLGADSIIAGERATLYSIILIFVFMIVSYALFGLFANIALACNLTLLIAALALTGSTLTLPGIAGIALTLGMAVDANVLIFERIKEELRSGTRIVQAVDAGYARAMATILDSNITTLIGGAALYFFGSGPIRGFGVTLCMGIIISMFTAITLTRLITVIWLKQTNPKTLPI